MVDETHVSITDSSSHSNSFIREPPTILSTQYEPLVPIYQSHTQPLPIITTGIKDSNSEAIITALKSLQDKIRQLELERVVTANKFDKLSKETRGGSPGNHSNSSSDDEEETTPPRRLHTDFTERLESLDTRYMLQSKELKLLKKRLKEATTRGGDEKENTISPHTTTRRDKSVSPHTTTRRDKSVSPHTTTRRGDSISPIKDTQDRLQELEDKQLRLHAEQLSTTSKLNTLEGQLLSSRRKVKKTPPTTSHQTHSDPTILHSTSSNEGKRKRRAVKGTVKKGLSPQGQERGKDIYITKPVPGVHYHLKMKDVPFVVGTSTGPSHSVTANYQKVVSLMKHHSPVLCGAVAAHSLPCNKPHHIRKPTSTQYTSSTRGRDSTVKEQYTANTTSTVGGGASVEELEGLLIALEAEFGRLSYEHQELAKLLQQCADHTSPDGRSHDKARIQSELSNIIDCLEGKNEQIQIVKRLLNTHKNKKTSRPATTGTRGCGVGVVDHLGGEDNLQVLRKMKRLQTTLQRDDLSWN